MVNIRNKSLAYQLGYNAGKQPPNSINYHSKIFIPIRSFSNPKIQKKQYIAGWKAGRQLLKRRR